MSKQRQRDRAARQAAQAEQERTSAAAPRSAGEQPPSARQPRRGQRAQDARDAATRAAVDAGRRPSRLSGRPVSQGPSRRPPSGGPAPAGRGRQPVYRQRRFPPLPWRLKLALALAWLSVLALSLVLVPGWQGRLGIMVVATFCLPLVVVIVRDPSRRTR